jgi:hypothetical protein
VAVGRVVDPLAAAALAAVRLEGVLPPRAPRVDQEVTAFQEQIHGLEPVRNWPFRLPIANVPHRLCKKYDVKRAEMDKLIKEDDLKSGADWRADWTRGARSNASPAGRHKLLSSGRFGPTCSLCIRRTVRCVERAV